MTSIRMAWILFLSFACWITYAGAVICRGSEIESSLGRCSNNPAAISCPDGTTCQCVSVLYNYCSVPTNTDSWRPAAHVLSNCGIPKYTAIATFNNGVYDWRGDKGHAGVFVRCVSGGFEMYDQWCANPMYLRLYPPGGWSGDSNFVFRTNAANYYVVTW